ncbi:MAG: hypothetical protein K9K76_07200 [Halanaerobiales bacterium]|nr:hypothetical protein [Halanaerobiales bacterium]
MSDEEKITSIILDKAVLRYDINKNKPNRVKSKLIIKKYKQEMLEKISKKLKNASDEEKQKFVEEMNKNFKNMSDEEKEMIKKELKIDNLTGEAIRKILINSGGPISLMALVQISGFSSYILLTSIMHASASLLGITLPFAAYTGATTSLAVLSSPLSILLASGLGGWAVIKSSKKFNELILIRIISNSQIIIKEKTELLEQKYKMNYLETKSSRPLLIEGKPKNIDPDNISNKKSESFESILDNNKWLKWFNNFNASSINKLKRDLKYLNKMEHEWNIEYLTLFNEKFTDIITNDDYNKEKIILLENSFWMFGNYITNITDYFSQKNKLLIENEEIYFNLIYSIKEFTYNKTEKKTKAFINLNEKILKQIPRTSQLIFPDVFEWFEKPSLNMSAYFLDMLELFDDYGCSREEIKELWIQWMAKLNNKLCLMSNSKLRLWKRIGGNSRETKHYIEKIEDELDKRQKNNKNKNNDDLLENLNKNIKIAIITLREKPAIRAKNNIQSRNPNIKVSVFTDTKLNSRIINYTKDSLAIIAWDSIKHATTQGLKKQLKENIYPENPLYPRSGGESAIIDAIEEYVKKYYN